MRQALAAALSRHLSAAYGEQLQGAQEDGGAEPPLIGRHRPDIYLTTATGGAVIGTVKTGPDLDDPSTREQLDDFTLHHGRNGERAMFWLAVPVGCRRRAIEAIADAAGEIHDGVHVLEVSVSATR